MATAAGLKIWSRSSAADDVLGFAERLRVERLLQWLRLSLLITPLMVLVASGPAAIAVVVWIVLAVSASFSTVELLLRYRADLLLRAQFVCRVVDCGLVYLVLVNYNAFLHDAYYDTAYDFYAPYVPADRLHDGAPRGASFKAKHRENRVPQVVRRPHPPR